jgi:hypothetical protein
MKLILPKAGKMMEVNLMIEESPYDGNGATIRCYCENEKDTQDLFDNITKEIMYCIRDDKMLTMKKLPSISTAEITLEEKLVVFTYDEVVVHNMTDQEKKKVMIKVVQNQGS